MKPTTISVFDWPGRLPATENLALYGALKRVAGVHGCLSWLSKVCQSQTVGHGSRVGASSLGAGSMPKRMCQLFFMFVLFVWGQALLAQSAAPAAQTESNNKVLPPLIAAPQPPCQFNPNRGPEMLVLSGGYFLMGSPDAEVDRYEDEGPEHWVAVQPFAMGRCEVSLAEFRQFIEQTEYSTDVEEPGSCYALNNAGDGFEGVVGADWDKPGFEQNDRHPVTCVSHNDALAYIVWLNERTGLEYRLPTEAEWEYAARAGSQTRFSFGDDDAYKQLCTYANIADQELEGESFAENWTLADCTDGYRFTAPIASYQPNGYGFYDMHGNLVEWTQDCWHNSYQTAAMDGKAWFAENSGECDKRVLRGGSWSDNPGYARSADRARSTTVDAYNSIGFRLARTL